MQICMEHTEKRTILIWTRKGKEEESRPVTHTVAQSSYGLSPVPWNKGFWSLHQTCIMYDLLQEVLLSLSC